MRRLLFFAVFAAAVSASAAPDLGGAKAYPNPVRVFAGETQVTFDNLTTDAHIRIYSAEGSLVHEVFRDDASGTYVWPLTNNNDLPVASGVYVYLITNRAEEKTRGRLVIIR